MNGNFILIGVIAHVQVPQIPVTASKLCVFNRWTAGVGEFTETVRLLAPDQTTLIRQSNVKFTLKDATHNATNVTLFGQLKFDTAGVYSVEVLVDDVMKLRYPLMLTVAWTGIREQLVVVGPALTQHLVLTRLQAEWFWFPLAHS